MRAFHGDPRIKAKYVRRMRLHRQLDQIVQGTWWHATDRKGCAVGCLLHEEAPFDLFPTVLGIPKTLGHAEEGLFEMMERMQARDFAVKFIEAPAVGADLRLVPAQYAYWLLTDKDYGFLSLPQVQEDHTLLQDGAAYL